MNNQFFALPASVFLRSVLSLAALTLLVPIANGQEDFQYENLTYTDNITTVRFHVAGFPHSYPVIELGGSAQLRLSFDDTSDEVRRYTYRLIHCDRDWTPSSLSPLEYTAGFAEDNLEDYDFSFRTLSQYIHYDLFFPNRNINLTKSGNYLLVVTDDEDEEMVVITRRFMVVESIAGVSGAVNRSARVSTIHSHQEVDFSVNTKQLRPRNPIQELRASVLQNGRWDNAVHDIMPSLMQRESVLFDHQGKVAFAGGNEFRNLDVRSINAPRADVMDITNEGTHYAMVLAPDRLRDQEIYLNYADINGDYVNFRFDRPIINLADEYLAANYDRLNLDFTGDYIDLTFILRTGSELEDDEIYLFGAFTEFRKKPAFRMTYNPAINSYVAKIRLKQGFYNYWYVTNKDAFGQVNAREPINLYRSEGNFDETENDYLVLLYYRPIGGRYDQLVGSEVLNSNVN